MRIAPLLVALALLPASAQAARPRIAVAPLQLTGSAPSQALRSSLVGGLEAVGLEVMPEAELLRLTARAPELQHCGTQVCLRRLAELLNVQAVVKARIEVVG